MHLMISFWMLTSPFMFPLSQAEKAGSLAIVSGIINSTDGADYSFVDSASGRFSRPEGIIILLTCGGLFAFKLIKRVVKTVTFLRPCFHQMGNFYQAMKQRYAGQDVRHKHKVDTHKSTKHVAMHESVDFETLLRENRIAGVRSYNILANPVYQRIFHLQGQHEDLDNFDDNTDETESVASGSIQKQLKLMEGFKTLKDALNIRKGTAISTIDQASKMYNENASAASTASKTSKLLGPKSSDANGSFLEVKSSGSFMPVKSASSAQEVSTETALLEPGKVLTDDEEMAPPPAQ
jgi:hypothetical protein